MCTDGSRRGICRIQMVGRQKDGICLFVRGAYEGQTRLCLSSGEETSSNGPYRLAPPEFNAGKLSIPRCQSRIARRRPLIGKRLIWPSGCDSSNRAFSQAWLAYLRGDFLSMSRLAKKKRQIHALATHPKWSCMPRERGLRFMYKGIDFTGCSSLQYKSGL